MKRNSILKIVNPVLAFLFLYQILTGLFNEVIPKEIFEVLHGVGGISLAVVGTLHLILNWNWVKINFFKGNSKG